jgi:hypothetical protein
MTRLDPFVFQFVKNNKSTQKERSLNNSHEQFHVGDARWNVFVLDRVVQQLFNDLPLASPITISVIVGIGKHADFATRTCETCTAE